MQIILLILLTLSLHADILKENYISIDLNDSHPKVVLDFESDNLDKFILLDTNDNGLISWNELKAKRDEIIGFVLPHLHIRTDGIVCDKNVSDFEVYRRVHQSYIKLHIDLICPLPTQQTTVGYDLFFDVDSGQKAFLSLSDQSSSARMLSAHANEISVTLQTPSALQSFLNFLIEGIWHIWIGFDHILFLMMLIIPSVIYYHAQSIIPQDSLRSTLMEVLKVVTAFSVAHSITLALSVLDIVQVDSRAVEIAIALSVLYTALNNLFAWTTKRIWILAFSFGLIHGFGFANVLKEMSLNARELVRSLLGFNLGVEIGQIIIVAAVVPLLFMIRKSSFYRIGILYGFSVITALIAAYWAVDRF